MEELIVLKSRLLSLIKEIDEYLWDYAPPTSLGDLVKIKDNSIFVFFNEDDNDESKSYRVGELVNDIFIIVELYNTPYEREKYIDGIAGMVQLNCKIFCKEKNLFIKTSLDALVLVNG